MRKFTSSIRFKIMQITVLFTLVLTIFLASVSFFIFQNYARTSIIQATEFNLQLVGGLIRQDIVNLNSMASFCALDNEITSYLLSDNPTGRKRLDAYNKLLEQYQTNRSSNYVQRLLATDQNDRIIQVGSSIINNFPITRYNLHTLEWIDTTEEFMWQTIVRDPYMPATTSACIPLVRPIYAPITRARIGTIYLTVSTQIITDQLRSYQLTEGSKLFLTMHGQEWQIDGQDFIFQEKNNYSVEKTLATARSTDTIVEEIVDANGEKYTSVSCPVGINGLVLTHDLPQSSFAQQRNVFLIFLICGCLLIQGFGILISRYFSHIFLRPVSQMRNKMIDIAAGDFTYDAAIEWDNELGDVGRGINKLSHDVQSLMETRLADEKKKRDLEYQMLQNQINPHFIYNTLNSIKWMATIQNATGIAEMTTAFSRLLKSVAKGNEELIPLREEFALLNDYCVIQQYRYGGSITLEIAEISDEDLCDCLIPRFTLQPLAENAIFHGIEPKGGVGSIWLHISQTETNDICIAMQDDGVGMSRETIEKIFSSTEDLEQQKFKQIGIRNVHRRIQYAFGPQYGITIQSVVGSYTRMEIRIPYRVGSPVPKEDTI